MLSERLIDLSCDLGEAMDEAGRETEAAIWPLITSANVACGGHTGDAESMERAVELAQNHTVRLGAHPSYPDRENFGRRSMDIRADQLATSILEQLSALREIAADYGVTVAHVKPHGALYGDAHSSRDLARVIVDAVRLWDPRAALVTSSRSLLFQVARERGVKVVPEAFADRRYRQNGSLVPRSEPGALLLQPEDAAEQAISLAHLRLVEADDGTMIEVPFATLCVHGDMPGVLPRLQAIREKLSRASFAFSHVARGQ